MLGMLEVGGGGGGHAPVAQMRSKPRAWMRASEHLIGSCGPTVPAFACVASQMCRAAGWRRATCPLQSSSKCLCVLVCVCVCPCHFF